jgi:hypothetical protein
MLYNIFFTYKNMPLELTPLKILTEGPRAQVTQEQVTQVTKQVHSILANQTPPFKKLVESLKVIVNLLYTENNFFPTIAECLKACTIFHDTLQEIVDDLGIPYDTSNPHFELELIKIFKTEGYHLHLNLFKPLLVFFPLLVPYTK